MRFRLRKKHPRLPPLREGRLRPDYSTLYPHVRAQRWMPLARLIRRCRVDPVRMRALAEHFEFRGGQPARNPAWPYLRQRLNDRPPSLSDLAEVGRAGSWRDLELSHDPKVR
jgi:hypothetical protein